ncbi:pirin family protein [Vogesella indigofera]|uniref:pirin family protein n=1 Tax=Vogesella indigofera TaxID=45465 RepID=UPI00234F23E5|nr:pirin family protein [Vogesella indigofera]MDC7710668.1 pirin family protein [Vogesella indigofera]
MSAISQRIEPRQQDIGFVVRRLLPVRGMRSVGPFVFLDHMGPAYFVAAGTAGDVRPHPHIGLATVTYLSQGAMMHRDSLGTVQRIEPGAINLMVAGRGIVHSERIPADIRAANVAVEGLQMWLALPQAQERCAPAFYHYPAEVLPQHDFERGSVQLLIGSAFGMVSPVKTFAPTLYAAWQLQGGGVLSLPQDVAERALYLIEGEVQVDGEMVRAGELVILSDSARELRASACVQGVIFGGAALDGPRYLDWNFVASDKSLLAAAREDWQAGRFAMVPGETEFIPLPA